MIDLYCERIAPGLWAEPINALTNLAFLLAAYFGWRQARARRRLSPGVLLLIVLIAAIGVGSFLFHTFATLWAAAADVIPIVLFQIAYLWRYTGDRLAWGYTARGAAVAALIGALLAGGQLATYANGSPAYLPALLTLLLLAVHDRHTNPAGNRLLMYASGLFAVSLLLRTIDPTLCPRLTSGTHFAWHLLNALVLYLLMLNLVRAPRSSAATPRA